MTWRAIYNKGRIHYFIKGERTLCNRVVPGKSFQVNPEEYYKQCKSCKNIFKTYDDLSNYIPTMNDPHTYGERNN